MCVRVRVRVRVYLDVRVIESRPCYYFHYLLGRSQLLHLSSRLRKTLVDYTFPCFCYMVQGGGRGWVEVGGAGGVWLTVK